ncbi:MAG: hypothetical protein WCP43_05270 [Dehalococcoidia bacterium]
MKFVRRADLDSRTRLRMALKMGCRDFRDWGRVSEVAREYGVSRQFLYDNEALLLRPFTPGGVPPAALSDEAVHRLILSIRLHCNGSAEGIARTLGEMGWCPGSTGHISEFLHATAKSCSLGIPCKGSAVILMLDEIFANGDPVFVVLEASSHCILDIVLMPDRKADTWEGVLRRLQEAGVDIGLLVKDQGSSLKAAAQALGLAERADLFHLLKPFDPYLPSLERRAYGAMEEEFERARVFGNRKCEGSLEKNLAKYEAARADTLRAMRASDNYDELHTCLHDAFNSFTAEGRPRTRTMAEGDIEAALSLMESEFPSHSGILAAVRFLRKNLPDYWGYFEELERIVRRQAGAITEHTLRAGCLAWQLERKAMAVKNPHLKNELAYQSKAQLELALTGAGDDLKTAIKALFAELDSNVRSSSPLEAINSVIRNYLNACRSQTTQESLTMLAFFLNHRTATRGKYAGSSPYERLTGLPEKASPIEQLLKASPRASKWETRHLARPPEATGLLNVA